MRKISYIVFDKVSKIYRNGKDEVLRDFSLEIEKGEFIVIVGPSGSGKSTLLELICGFEELTSGVINLDGKELTNIEPKDRDVAMVFQNYALYPHLTAYENIAFGMKIRKVKKDIIESKVKWVAEVLGIKEFLKEKPKNLSGGQRQRIALARAIVREPKLFLMDEPLSNLDAKLRYTTSNEIVNLNQNINGTTIYVTHDQREALTMADRIVVLKEGKIQQVGTPNEIYNNPKNIFVAEFIGSPQINLFNFKVEDNKIKLDCGVVLKKTDKFNNLEENKKYILGIRAEDISNNIDDNSIKAKIQKVEYLGGEVILHLQYDKYTFLSKVYNIKEYKSGEFIDISFNLKESNIFDFNTKENIKEKNT